MGHTSFSWMTSERQSNLMELQKQKTSSINSILRLGAELKKDSHVVGQHNHAGLPEGFVDLNNIDSTIILSPRYSAKDNFIGRPIKGYKVPRIILTKSAAEALKKAQARFQEAVYSLVVYDDYRPQTAVNDFVQWSKNPKDQKMKAFKASW